MPVLNQRLAIGPSCGPLFDAIPVPAIVTRVGDDTIVAVNAEAARLTNAHGEDAVGRTVTDFYLDRDDRVRFVEAVTRDGRAEGMVVGIRRGDGAPLWVRTSGRLVSVDGQAAILSVFTDVSEQVATEHALRAATRAKTEFLASMSHELRTPLNGILGYVQVLQRENALSPVQREGLDVIGRCGVYLLELINDVLDLSRIEAGRVDHEPAPTDLQELVADVMRIIGDAARAKRLRLVEQIEPGLPRRVILDGRRLRQVLLNLLGNAVKFTEVGEVRLMVGRDEPGRLRFDIVDTGPGIEPENLGLIFEAFRQTSRGAAAGGTGLGLTISERLVRTMGGRLQVASTLDIGTQFFFSLPLDADERAAAREASDTAELSVHARLAPGVSLSALVVDDNAVNRRVLAALLEGAGITVYSAGGGEEGMALARRHRPDVILLDWLMPDVNGLAVVHRLRADAATLDIPVLAITASPSRAARDEAIRAGCIDLLSKPVGVGAVFARLRRHLGVPFVVDAAAAPPSRPPLAREGIGGAVARDLRAAAALGDVTGLAGIARELGGRDPSLAPLARQVSDLAAGFDFDALVRLAGWLESQDATAHVSQ